MSAGGRMYEPVAVTAEDLGVARGGRTLFKAVNFHIAAGESLALKGPNGSGKTSLLRAVAGLLRPSAGRIRVDGAEEAQLAMHYMAHANALKAALSVSAHVRFWAETMGQGPAPADALARVGLSDIADLPAGRLSQGQARRLALSRLVAAPRPIWLLDEPAAGLDARSKAMLDLMIDDHLRVGGVIIAALHEPLGRAMNNTLELGA